ncbi:MAG: FkbM family methyltransferase [bacterium]
MFSMLRPIDRLKDYILCALTLGTGPRAMCSILWRETKNIRVRLNLGAYSPKEVYSLQTIYGLLYFRDNFGDITNLVSLLYHQVYRLRGLSQEGVILDVGANIGLAAKWFAHHNPGRSIYCFEPLAANAALIRLNCPGAKVEQVAVGARRGRVKLRVDRDSVMASSISCRWETEEVEFDVISLDEFAGTRALEQVALMKIDAEGMEVEILRGCQETLRRTQQVVMETHSRSLHDDAIGHLRHAGFHIDSEQFGVTTGLLFASCPNERCPADALAGRAGVGR